MKNRVVKCLTDKLKQIDKSVTIYLDSVMQSKKEFYIVLSVESSGTENVGINIQNKMFAVDIAFVNRKNSKEISKKIVDFTEQCEAFFNVLEIDGNEIFPEDYLEFETDGVQHINLTVAFPQYIEWSDK
ncbi:phage tail terminator family protein [Vagococcus sp. JNUCC 83]